MDTIEQRLQRLEDEAAIRTLVARFADAAVLADYEAFRSLWTTNGKWTIHEPFLMSAEGAENINEMLRQLRKGRAFFAQFVHSGIITITGNKANSRWIIHEESEGPANVFYNNFGVYLDHLERTIEGSWQFVSRDYHYMWLDTEAFPGEPLMLPFMKGEI